MGLTAGAKKTPREHNIEWRKIMSLMNLTAVELGKKIKNKEVTVVEATKAALDAIDRNEEKIGAFVTVD